MTEDLTDEETLEEETSLPTASEETATEVPKETTEPTVDYKKKFIDSQREAIRLAKENESLKIQPKEAETKRVETDIDSSIDKKVQEKIAPLMAQQTKDTIDKWFDKNPDAIDYLKDIDENYLNTPGKTIAEKLENTYLIAKKDTMKEAGKKEMAFAIYQKEQAIASGGGASSQQSASSLPQLTTEEKQVARKMGLTEEVYAQRKLEK